MAYWYTYPCVESPKEQEQKSTVSLRQTLKIDHNIHKKRDFVEALGKHPCLYAFEERDYIAWNLPLEVPVVKRNPIYHFADIVTYKTLKRIQYGLRKIRYFHMHRIPCGKLEVCASTLRYIFAMSSEWVVHMGLDKVQTTAEYTSNVCWVAATILKFQSMYGSYNLNSIH